MTPTPTEAKWNAAQGIEPGTLHHPFGMTYRRVTIPLSKAWATPEMEATLMRWLTCMLRPPRLCQGNTLALHDGPFGPRDTGYRWQLDGSNDWWAEVKGDTLVLACRYERQPLAELATWVAAKVSP